MLNYDNKLTISSGNNNTRMDEQQATNQSSALDPGTQTGAKTASDAPILQNEEELKKKMEAILAMEGEEGRLKRERIEKEKEEAEMIGKLEKEKTVIKTKLEEIAKKKEKLELSWIDLSQKMGELKKLLDPISLAETNIEKDVQAKNQEEHATDDIKKRQEFEKERQTMETKRQVIEKEKWVIENKMLELTAVMNEDKLKYQSVLSEEYSLVDKTKEIDEKIRSIKVV